MKVYELIVSFDKFFNLIYNFKQKKSKIKEIEK